jgi:hypothetical protein
LLNGKTEIDSNIKQIVKMQKLALKTKNLIDEGRFVEIEKFWVSVLGVLNLKEKETN